MLDYVLVRRGLSVRLWSLKQGASSVFLGKNKTKKCKKGLKILTFS
jgi:hypothetical protein